MKIKQKEIVSDVVSKLIQKNIVPDCTYEKGQQIIAEVFKSLYKQLEDPAKMVFNNWGIRIKKTILSPRTIVDLRDKTKTISVPATSRFSLKLMTDPNKDEAE